MCQQKTVQKRTRLTRFRLLKSLFGHKMRAKARKISHFKPNFRANVRTFYTICDKNVHIRDLIAKNLKKLTNFRYFRPKLSVCNASAVGASENFWVCHRRTACRVIKRGFCSPNLGGRKDTSAPPLSKVGGRSPPLPPPPAPTPMIRYCVR